MNTNDLKIKQAVLKAVRKVSGAAFNKKLGDRFAICFTVTEEIKVISMYATKDGEHIECFDNSWLFDSELTSVWQASFPESIDDIPRFQSDVEKGLADIFKYVKAHHE